MNDTVLDPALSVILFFVMPCSSTRVSREGRKEVRSLCFFFVLFFIFKGRGSLARKLGVRDIFLGHRNSSFVGGCRHGHVR